MYAQLKRIHQRPAVFSTYTAPTLWTEPHLADQMLQLHLSQDTVLASRPLFAIDRMVTWIDQTFGLAGRSVCDLGCGPGLYANRFAERGADVHGLDISRTSLEYARRHAPTQHGTVTYRVADYLKDPLPEQQDLVTLIYCDLCPLSPSQRETLLAKVHKALVPGGTFLLDVFSMKAFERVIERVAFERNLMNGFWSAQDYFAFQHTFRYEGEAVSLDRFTIVEENRTWDVYNWLKYFSQDEIHEDLKQAGFRTITFSDGFDVDRSDEMTFAVIATA